MLDEIGLERTAVSAMGDAAMNLISADRSEREAGVAFMKNGIDCSAALGATTLSGPLHSTLGLFSGDGPTAEEFARSVGSQRAIGEHAASRGLTIGLEALNRFECYLVNTMDALSAHLDEIGHPNIRAMYDTFHANIEEADPIGAYTRNLRHIAHIHSGIDHTITVSIHLFHHVHREDVIGIRRIIGSCHMELVGNIISIGEPCQGAEGQNSDQTHRQSNGKNLFLVQLHFDFLLSCRIYLYLLLRYLRTIPYRSGKIRN
jgi:hypothetical protein